MTNVADASEVRCVVIGDSASGKEMMLKKYACYSGVPYDITNGRLVTAFNGHKCVFLDSAQVNDDEPVHVFLLCVSVARQAIVEETARVIMNTVLDRINAVPFVLIGTQIEKRLLIDFNSINGYCNEASYLPMPLHRAEKFAKQIGASKYLECSEVTGEGLEEVFEEAFEIGRAHALEKLKGSSRRKSSMGTARMKKIESCITQ